MKNGSYKKMPMKASGSKGKSSPDKAVGGHDSKMASSSSKGKSGSMSPAIKEGKVITY